MDSSRRRLALRFIGLAAAMTAGGKLISRMMTPTVEYVFDFSKGQISFKDFDRIEDQILDKPRIYEIERSMRASNTLLNKRIIRSENALTVQYSFQSMVGAVEFRDLMNDAALANRGLINSMKVKIRRRLFMT